MITRLWLLKTDPSGNTQWNRTFGENAMGVLAEQTRDGGYIAVGTDLAGSGGGDAWLIKLRPADAAPLGHVTGRVTDVPTGDGIADVRVEVIGASPSSATTSSNGEYTLALAPGTYDLTASATGYQSKTKAGVAVTAGQTTTVNFALTPLPPRDNTPIARAKDIAGQPKTMYPDTVYTVTAKYLDPDGRDDLKNCHLRLRHPTKPLTMMWNQADGHFSPWAGEEGANYVTLTNVTATPITEGGLEGYRLTWSFKITDRWPEAADSVDFGVSASDDGNLESGWAYDDTHASFSKPGFTCSVFLRKQGTSDSTTSIWIRDLFDIHVSVSGGSPVDIRFSSDDKQDGKATGEWTRWYKWSTSSGDEGWDSDRKNMRWSFVTGGPKEVWAEVRDATGRRTCSCSANTYGDFRFVHISDVHIGDEWRGGSARLNFAKALETVSLITPKPAFVLITGDLIDYGGAAFFSSFLSALESLEGIPVYVVPGNHDRYLAPLRTGDLKAYVQAGVHNLRPLDSWNLTSPYGDNLYDYRFDYGGFTFIGMDSGPDVWRPYALDHILDVKGAGLTSSQREACESMSGGLPKIIFMHHPVVNTNWPDDLGITVQRADDPAAYFLDATVGK